MIEKILVAIDGSEHAWRALDLATDIAKGYNAQLIALHVVPFEPMPSALREFARAEHIPIEEENYRYHYSKTLGDKLTAQAEARARGKGYDRVTSLSIEGKPAESIIATAEEEGVDMIFVGSRGVSDVKGLLLGSVSHRVAHLSHCTCVTVK